MLSAIAKRRRISKRPLHQVAAAARRGDQRSGARLEKLDDAALHAYRQFRKGSTGQTLDDLLVKLSPLCVKPQAHAGLRHFDVR